MLRNKGNYDYGRLVNRFVGFGGIIGILLEVIFRTLVYAGMMPPNSDAEPAVISQNILTCVSMILISIGTSAQREMYLKRKF